MRFYTRKKRSPQLIIVSLIDILAILLIFFIVSTTFRKEQPRLQINLPESQSAEVVAAALQDRDRAVIVGEHTYGKGSIQEPSTLSDGSALELTVGTYFTPSGRSLDGVGIDPDVLVSAKAGSATAEQRALEVIRGLVAASDSTQRG